MIPSNLKHQTSINMTCGVKHPRLLLPAHLEYLSWPRALGLFAVLALPIVLLGMRSLNGLGLVRKWWPSAFGWECWALFILIIGGARWQRLNKNVE